MSTYILTSYFKGDFPTPFAKRLEEVIVKRDRFAFVASEFERGFEKTQRYFEEIVEKFTRAGVVFGSAVCVDGRLSADQMRAAVAGADVLWLSGGDTEAENKYLKKYGLWELLQGHLGVLMGMSAGAINLGPVAPPQHPDGQSFAALGCVDYCTEPHFDPVSPLPEIVAFSKQETVLGLCDEAAVICKDGERELFGDVYQLADGVVSVLRKDVPYGDRSALGSEVTVVMDRPLGSAHPRHPEMIYPVNYGYVPHHFAGDGAEQDAYVLGVTVPVRDFCGKVIAIVHRLDDQEDKWVVAPEGVQLTREEIEKQVEFQEQYFEHEIIM